MFDVLNVLMLTTGSCVTMLAALCLTSAKRIATITLNDARVMWAMHRRSARCGHRKWRPLTRKKGKIIGFQCECGYKYTQKRPLVSRTPKCR